MLTSSVRHHQNSHKNRLVAHSTCVVSHIIKHHYLQSHGAQLITTKSRYKNDRRTHTHNTQTRSFSSQTDNNRWNKWRQSRSHAVDQTSRQRGFSANCQSPRDSTPSFSSGRSREIVRVRVLIESWSLSRAILYFDSAWRISWDF